MTVKPKRRDLISSRSRLCIRDFMSGTTLREIDDMWQDEGFPVAIDPEPVGGQRVTRFQGYLDLVDWTNEGEVARALRVLNVALAGTHDPSRGVAPHPSAHSRLKRLLQQDGLDLTDDWRILGSPTVVVSALHLQGIADSSVVQEHIARIQNALGRDDPAQVIGSAKELVESTAKLVLRQLGEAADDGEDLPQLVRRAQSALMIHPSQGPDAGPDGTDAVRKILGAASTITSGMAELRNRGYGTGHGTAMPRKGLGVRHARLAVNAARLWCEFILDTLADDKAPWRQARDAP